MEEFKGNTIYTCSLSYICAGGPKSKDFWPTVKSFLTNKGNVKQKNTVLSENDVLITKQDEICEFFNIFFC
jgi:hypothetical protein